ncbi:MULTISPECIES: TrkH family potassium uptake protein [unclassified Nocardioides]|uniref:TrkH family potassium uptake protein n=1 Tax=unclassified Nocardioides TaxID=2615069 RepID=UPI0006F27FF2|nr:MULTISPECIES: potassium transporter TrkG [unclassified Nocardioides]KQY64504.1 ATPase [Nocardioides sp. Root140]KQZ70429.1 ATPase [Nocardioides sp. Root151]KRF18289.1 ATPase [Nocardioides sp. Soil796]
MKRTLMHPTRIVPLAFLMAIVVGTLLLSLPAATPGPNRPPVLTAAFTSVSAVCVTGLTTVDTATYWSPFGQVVVLSLIQVGGFGIMTLATLLGLLVSGRLRLSSSLIAQAETHTMNIGEVRHVVRRVAITMLSFEAVFALILAGRFRANYDDTWGTALWHGLFHSVSAFNNAGFALYSDNLIGFVSDAWIAFPICVAIIVGGLGFPVLFELRRKWRRPRMWTVHTRLTVYGSVFLLVVGTLAFLALEWTNQGTLGGLSPWGKVVGGVTGGVVPRTAGFNSVDYGAITPETMAVNYLLMFIGGGSAGTAGGIKVTTFFLLAFAIFAEIRGERDTTVAHRSVSHSTIRQALTVVLLAIAAIATGTMVILMATDYALDVVLFESISAFATVGLSTGITPDLPPVAEVTLMVLMYVGRVGTITVASALAFRRGHRHYQLPEERPVVG